MKPGIRVKFVGILMLAALLPLVVAAIATYVLGNRYYRDSAGQIFQSRAQQLANYLELSVTGHTGSLYDRVALADFYERVQAINQERRSRTEEDIWTEIVELEQRWLDLPEDSVEIRSLMENELGMALREFQNLSPLFAEIFVTDDVGRLIATTGKTTTYWHAFKSWWQIGRQQVFKQAHVEGVNYDESSAVYSFDVSIPIRDWRNPEAPPVGVVKAVIQAAPLFFDLAITVADDAKWKIVLEDGSVLFGPVPIERRIPESAREPLLQFESGWMLRKLREQEDRRMAGFATLPWLSSLPFAENDDFEPTGSILPEPDLPGLPLDLGEFVQGAEHDLWKPAEWTPVQRIYVIVHENAADVLAPIRTQLLLIMTTGVIFALGCFFVGLYLAQYHIIRPINLIQTAAKNIAASAKLHRLGDSSARVQETPIDPFTKELLDKISHLKSEDELGELARDFSSMASRVLSYHAHLEADIHSRITEIQGDLVIAREFQEALMPRDYPKVPGVSTPESLNLQFNHIYKPASTVGGDFFNVIKLSEDRAGIFIADVMGHGSRSALVTAIVATLLHDLAPKSSDPAQFMAALNRHFHQLIQHSKQIIFVTAFYLVIDTRERRALFSSAGHPSPLLVQRRKGKVKPLIHPMQNDTALGLLEDSTYACFSRPITEDDMFLLFTDGLFEALNPKGEEFGLKKLSEVVTRNMEFSASELGRRILETIHRYSGFAAQSDDICLVTVEVNPPIVPDSAVESGHANRRQF